MLAEERTGPSRDPAPARRHRAPPTHEPRARPRLFVRRSSARPLEHAGGAAPTRPAHGAGTWHDTGRKLRRYEPSSRSLPDPRPIAPAKVFAGVHRGSARASPSSLVIRSSAVKDLRPATGPTPRGATAT